MTVEEALDHFLGPQPPWWKIHHRIDWGICAKFVRECWAGSPRFLLYRCLTCHTVLSGKTRCKCGGGKFSPIKPSSWKVFIVLLRERK